MSTSIQAFWNLPRNHFFNFLPTIWLPLEISPGTGARAPKIIILPVGMDLDESSWIFRGEHVFCFSADFKVPRCRIGLLWTQSTTGKALYKGDLQLNNQIAPCQKIDTVPEPLKTKSRIKAVRNSCASVKTTWKNRLFNRLNAPDWSLVRLS